jgi:AraC-like DNA-binding protein
MLQAAQLRTAVYATVWLEPPWGVRIPKSRAAAFHAVVAGRCWFRRGEAVPVLLEAGDAVVLSHGDAHTFFDDPRSPVHTIDLAAEGTRPQLPPRPPGSDRPGITAVVCGHLWFDDATANPLVALLPPELLLRGDRAGPSPSFLLPMLRFVAGETDRPGVGSDLVLARLSDVIVIQAIRAHVEDLPFEGHGWLGALSDAQLGRVLALMHAQPERPWTVATLASEVGTSRSSLAARFTGALGETPLHYLTRFRIQRAQRLLRGTSASIAEVALRVGYQTEPAFSRAFKRWVGTAPGAFRRGAQASSPEAPRSRRRRRAASG